MMSRITLVAFMATLALCGASAYEELLVALFEAYKPVIAECSQSYGVSDDQIQGAIQTVDPSGVDSCFGGCVLKKTNVINSEGKYDASVGLSQLKNHVKNDEYYSKIEKIANECASVNDETVSDGAAGCDRAKLLLACVVKHKSELPM